MAKIFDKFENNELSLSFRNNETIAIVLNDDLTIKYDLLNAEYQILIFSNANKKINLIENGSIENADVQITYVDLNNYDLNQKTNIDIKNGGHLEIKTTFLATKTKKIDFNLNNLAINTYSQINNNVVCLNDADFNLNVVGKIIKGARGSKCFQKSNCLTFENPKVAKILPVLLIDENDVEASHSLSSGTIDEDVLFYMNSRGLSQKEALSLLLNSYLMPNEEFYNLFNANYLAQIAKNKVQEICSI